MTLDTRALRDAHAKTTKGRWAVGRQCVTGQYVMGTSTVIADCRDRDAAFIVLAHEQMPALLDAIEQAEKDDAEWVRVGNRYEAEVESLRAENNKLKGLIHSEMLTDAHYCESHEMAFQTAESAPAECPHCKVEALRAEVARLTAIVAGDSPNYTPDALQEFAARGFKREKAGTE